MKNLPIIQSCDGCYACCMEMVRPPGFAAVILCPEAWPSDSEDHELVATMPTAAREAITKSLAEQSNDDEGPCCWLDLETRR